MIEIGIIGFGRIGAEHAGWISSSRHVRVGGVFDPTSQRRRLAIDRNLPTDDTLDALLARPNVQAVLISTPSAMHFGHAGLALAAGKHAMIEKPMALTLAQSRELASLAAKHGRIISVFHNRRWDLDYLTVGNAIRGGAFGRVINIESRISQFASCVGPAAREWRPSWRNEAAFGGGGLYDWGSHWLDQLWQLLLPAKPIRVFAQLRGNVWTKDCDDFARVLVDFDNGAVGLVEINTTSTQPLPRWQINGTLGSAQSATDLQYRTQEWAKLQFKPADNSPAQLLPLAEAGLTESQIWDRFAGAVAGDVPPAVTVDSVLPTMALLDAARRSSTTGQAIDVREAFAKV